MSTQTRKMQPTSNPSLSAQDFQQLNQARRESMNEINEKMIQMQQAQSLGTDLWNQQYDLDSMMDQNVTPSGFLPPNPNFNEFSSQPAFMMADFLKTGLTPLEITTRQANGNFDQSMWDYFSLDPAAPQQQSSQLVAPTDLTAAPPPLSPKQTSASVDQQQQQQQQHHQQTAQQTNSRPTNNPPDPTVKTPKKRGRKRKQLDAKAKVEERKKFLERNRVAANRCRERKKSYVSNLEQRQKEMLSRNQILRQEVERLNEEVAQLRTMVSVKCECSEERLQHNLRAGLKGSLGEGDAVEAVVGKFTILRAGGVPTGDRSLSSSSTHLFTGVKGFEEGEGGSPSEVESVAESLFSAYRDGKEGEGEEGGGGDHHSTAESSPVELSEADKSRYPPL